MLIKQCADGYWYTPHNTQVRIRIGGDNFDFRWDFIEGQVLHVFAKDGKQYDLLFANRGSLVSVIHTNFGATPKKNGEHQEVTEFEVDMLCDWSQFFRQYFGFEGGGSEQAIDDRYINQHFLDKFEKTPNVPEEWVRPT